MCKLIRKTFSFWELWYCSLNSEKDLLCHFVSSLSFYLTCKQCAASISPPGGLTSAAWWLKTRCMASAWKALLKPHRYLWSLCSRLVSLPFHDTPYLSWGLLSLSSAVLVGFLIVPCCYFPFFFYVMAPESEESWPLDLCHMYFLFSLPLLICSCLVWMRVPVCARVETRGHQPQVPLLGAVHPALCYFETSLS